MSCSDIPNKNFLSPVGFRFILTRSPSVDFYCNYATLPAISLGTAIQPSYLKDIEVPGDKLQYADLTIRFLVDEDMVNYIEMYKWLVSLGYPRTIQETQDPKNYNRSYSNATLQILNSNYNPNCSVNFNRIFPVDLSTIEFDATISDIQYVTAQASFKYLYYTLTDSEGVTY